MPTTYQTISSSDFSGGIDNTSTVDKLKEGFVEDLVNVDPLTNGPLRKRPGYEIVGGNLPLKVVSYASSAATHKVTITLSSNIKLDGKFTSIPVLISGVVAGGTGDFGTTRALVVTAVRETGVTATNVFTFTPSYLDVTITNTTNCSMYVWGLPYEEVTPTPILFVDTFRSELEERLVCGWKGLILANYSATELSYTSPFLGAYLATSKAATQVVGPAFVLTSATSLKADYFKFDNVTSGWVRGSSISYVGSANQVKYTIPTTNYTKVGNGINTSGSNFLTVQKAGRSCHIGRFYIISITEITGAIEVIVENSAVSSADFDETSSGFLAGIFSDALELTADSEFITADYITTTLFGTDNWYEVVASTGVFVSFDGIAEEFSITSGATVRGKRTSKLQRLTPKTEVISNYTVYHSSLPFINDSLLQISTGLNTKVRQARTPSLPATATVVDYGDRRTLDVGTAGTTDTLVVGQLLALRQSGRHSDVVEILTIESAGVYGIVSKGVVGTYTVKFVTDSVTLDREIELETVSTITGDIQINSRWIPIEHPSDTFTTTPKYYSEYYTNYTTPMKSIMCQDSMYITNGIDPVLKFDGTSLILAGIPNWQLTGIIISNDEARTSTSTPLAVLPDVIGDTTINEIYITNNLSLSAVNIGDRLRHAGTGTIHTVTGKPALTTVVVTPAFASTATITFKVMQRIKYYARLDITDINGNKINGAAYGLTDFTVDRYTAAQQVGIQFTNPPISSFINYSRVDLVIYRTLPEGVIYYEAGRIPINFNEVSGHTTWFDTMYDSEILLNGPDTTSLFYDFPNGTPPTTLHSPITSKYTTSLNNRMILANCEGSPRIDISVKGGTLGVVGNRFLFRKDNTSVATTSDGVNVQGFTVVNTFKAITSYGPLSPGIMSVTCANHGRVAGDWVFIHRSLGNSNLELEGWFRVDSLSVTTPTSVFYIRNTEYTSAFNPSGYTQYEMYYTTNIYDVPIVLNSILFATGYNIPTVMNLLALAINNQQTIASTLGISPWLSAFSGNGYQSQQIVIESKYTTVEVVLPAFAAPIQVFGNGARRTSAAEVGAEVALFPSRLLLSYPNYPEVFDNPYGTDTTSESVIDVNPADGQEITAIMPAFGQSTFGGGAKEASLLVFKQNSIYLVDILTKGIQKLETGGVGCQSPYSPCPTFGGVTFATSSGIYRVVDDRTLQFMGRNISKGWLSEVDRTALENSFGHNDILRKKYILSFLTKEGIRKLAVYNYDKETQGQGNGSWTYYDNIDAVNFCNNSIGAYFATSTGSIMRLLEDEYRDDGEAISSEITFRSMDFGDSGIRKSIKSFRIHFSNENTTTVGTSILMSIDMNSTFLALDPSTQTKSPNNSNLYDDVDRKISCIQFSPFTRKLNQLQLQLANVAIDEVFEVSAIDFRVAGLGGEAATEAKDT